MSAEEIEAEWRATLEAWFADPARVPLKRGVRELLAWLRHATPPVPCWIATSNTARVVARALAAHGLAACFAGTVTSADVAHPKPAPDVYVAAAQRALGAAYAPHAVLVVEDHGPSALAARALGMRVCAVHDAFRTAAAQWPAFAAAADYVAVHSLAELAAQLAGPPASASRYCSACDSTTQLSELPGTQQHVSGGDSSSSV